MTFSNDLENRHNWNDSGHNPVCTDSQEPHMVT